MSIYREKPNYQTTPSLWQRLGKLLLILIIVAGLAAAAFLLFFRGYVIDTPQGPRLELPFLAKKTEAAPAFSGDTGVTLPLTEEAPDSLLEPLHAIYLPTDSITDGSVEERLRGAGCNGAIFDMRTEDGALQYVSGLPLAIESGASAALPNLNEAIRAMNRTPELYTIARVSCFPDAKLAESRPELALKRISGSPWRDAAQTLWLAPTQDTVQSYLLEICRELSALGFDEILLTNCAYPSQGDFSQLSDRSDYNTAALNVTLEDFCREVRRVADEEGFCLSILWEGAPAEEDGTQRSGQTLSSLVLAAHRVWMVGEYEDAEEVFAAQGLSSSNASFVSILPQSGIYSLSWAIF